MSEEMRWARISRKGRRAALAGKFPTGMADGTRLIATIMAITNAEMESENVRIVANQLLDHCDGDFDEAIDALLSGRAVLERFQ
jgi:hypothetical protein